MGKTHDIEGEVAGTFVSACAWNSALNMSCSTHKMLGIISVGSCNNRGTVLDGRSMHSKYGYPTNREQCQTGN